MKARILFPVVVTLLLGLALAASAATVTPPPDAPSWWNSETAEYWGYYYEQVDPPIQESVANFPEFAVTVEDVGTTYRVTMRNGFRFWAVKEFWIRVEGVGATGVPTFPANPVIGRNNNPPNSAVQLKQPYPLRDFNVMTGAWSVTVWGFAIPQPDWIDFTFTAPGSDWTTLWVGEECTPEPGSLLALGTGLMGLVGLAIRRRR